MINGLNPGAITQVRVVLRLTVVTDVLNIRASNHTNHQPLATDFLNAILTWMFTVIQLNPTLLVPAYYYMTMTVERANN